MSKKKSGMPNSDERKPRRRKPDAMALAQAEVDAAKAESVTTPFDGPPPHNEPERRPAEIFAEAAAVEAPAPGPLAEIPPAAPRALRMGDLSRAAQRALAGLASNLHRASSQIEAFESDPTIPADVRAQMGTNELIRQGLAVERRAYFITELGASVAASACIEVTRPVAAS